ncbi:ANM_HP_G0278300.mRNA.1.CDS.1 [Saccharomyces cerevisiae]|nr:ANM_HP_G0009100.mRNA.1.CDS.1 [Saccharomyces cerevisiae]CAI5212851.1 ANM_HP_G0278300.mRNA.1.CDS.1 [Saccharomyces cerevisiae]CAI6834505.1 ANM_HP_G0009100.mRNA.1.CDS.1 [Saccharomyces cerevisiae]CAI7018440.1 ANM_HP_G0278300.mRNA.1.CDS.1 [Saccharomyces cerevisiae]
MAHEKFSIPENFTLAQSLQLLYSVVKNQYKNLADLIINSKGNKDTVTYGKIHKNLDTLLVYVNEGLRKIEKTYTLKKGLGNLVVDHPELRSIIEDFQILGQDIRIARRKAETLMAEGNGSPSLSSSSSVLGLGTGNGLRFPKLWRMGSKRDKLKEADEKEARINKQADNIRRARKLEEEKKLGAKLQYERDLELQREKLIELKVKEKVEFEVAQKLEEERVKREEEERKRREQAEKKRISTLKHKRKTNYKSRASLDNFSSSSKSSGKIDNSLIKRRSLDVVRTSGERVRTPVRKSMEAAEIGMAAQLAWSQYQNGANHSKVSNNGSHSNELQIRNKPTPPLKKRYDYKKPTVNRPIIKSPTLNRQNSKSSRNIPTNSKLKASKSNTNKVSRRNEQNVEPSSPVLVSATAVPAESKPMRSKSGTPDKESSASSSLDSRKEDILKSVQGVDRNACEQILNEILVTDEKVYWEDIAGLRNAKNSLKEAVVYPFLRPDLFKGLREPVRGMLLFGPPGTGKTMIAKAVATESNSTFFSVSASSLLSKYLGESEKLVRALFYMAKKLSPSIIFIDEIDSMLTARSDNENESSRRIKTELLIQWSSLSSATAQSEDRNNTLDSRVLVLGATNLPWAIDDAARRRFSRKLYIPLPDYETRLYHLKRLMAKQKNSLQDLDYELITEMTEGFSGSDLTSLAKEAAMEPIRDLGDKLMFADFDKIRGIEIKDFQNALLTIKKSVSSESLQKYEEWSSKFGSNGS